MSIVFSFYSWSFPEYMSIAFSFKFSQAAAETNVA